MFVFSSVVFVIPAASAQTKDCLELLKHLGVPIIQVWPTQKIYRFVFRMLSLFLLHLCLFFLTGSCCRLQETLRHCALGWWGRGLCTLWHQRTWTRCPLVPILLFASLTPKEMGKNYVVDVLLKGLLLSLSVPCFFQQPFIQTFQST